MRASLNKASQAARTLPPGCACRSASSALFKPSVTTSAIDALNERPGTMLRAAAAAPRHEDMNKLALKLSASLLPLLALAAAPPQSGPATAMTPDVVAKYE